MNSSYHCIAWSGSFLRWAASGLSGRLWTGCGRSARWRQCRRWQQEQQQLTRPTTASSRTSCTYFILWCFLTRTLSRNTASSCAHHLWSLLVTAIVFSSCWWWLLYDDYNCPPSNVLLQWCSCCCNVLFAGLSLGDLLLLFVLVFDWFWLCCRSLQRWSWVCCYPADHYNNDLGCVMFITTVILQL